jgi:hypothetical protein
MSVQEIIDEWPKLSEQDREMILRRPVSMDEGFEPTPAMEETIRQGMRSLREEKTYSTAEVRARIASGLRSNLLRSSFPHPEIFTFCVDKLATFPQKRLYQTLGFSTGGGRRLHNREKERSPHVYSDCSQN